MQVNSLTKTFTILLAGLLVSLAAMLAFRPALLTGGGGVSPAVVTAMLLPVAMVLGTVVNSAADLCIRRVFYDHEARVARLTAQTRMERTHAAYKELFRQRLDRHPAYGPLAAEIRAAQEGQGDRISFGATSQIASAMFLRKAGKENFDWVTSHYALYYLATDLAVALPLVWLMLVLGPLGVWSALGTLVLILGAVWLLVSVAVDRYLYTHICLYREGLLSLAEAPPGLDESAAMRTASDMAKLYHNPRCSKSREALKLLEARGISPEIVLYLQTRPDAAEIRDLLNRLGLPARDLLRTGESKAKELGLKDAGEDEIVAAMADHPVLIERPVLVTQKGARIGRPPEKVLEIL